MYWSSTEKEWMNARGINASFLDSIGELVEETAKLQENVEFWKVVQGKIVPGDGQPHPIKETSFVEADGCQMGKGGFKLPAFEGGRLESGRLLAKYETEMKEQGARHKAKIKQLRPLVMPKRSDVFMESAPEPVHPLDFVRVPLGNNRFLVCTEKQRLRAKSEAKEIAKARQEIEAGKRKPRFVRVRSIEGFKVHSSVISSLGRYSGFTEFGVNHLNIRKPCKQFVPGAKLQPFGEEYSESLATIKSGRSFPGSVFDGFKKVSLRSGYELRTDWNKELPEPQPKDVSYPHGPLILWKGGDLWKMKHATSKYRTVSLDQMYDGFFAELEQGGDFVEPSWAIQPGSNPWDKLMEEHQHQVNLARRANLQREIDQIRLSMKPVQWRVLKGWALGLTVKEIAASERKLNVGAANKVLQRIRKTLPSQRVSAEMSI